MEMHTAAPARENRRVMLVGTIATLEVAIGIALMTAARPARAVLLDTVTVYGCSGTLVTDGFGRESCVQDSGSAGGAGGGGGGGNGVGGWDGGGGGGTGPTDDTTNDQADLTDCDEQKAKKKQSAQVTSRPVIIASGNKILPELDFEVPPGELRLGVSRHYDKSLARAGVFGARWSSSFEFTLSFDRSGTLCEGKLGGVVSCGSTQPITRILAYRSSGFSSEFLRGTDGVWRDERGMTIVAAGTGWILTEPNGYQQHYDSYGRPTKVLDERGLGLTFTYNASNQLQKITHSSGRAVQFTWANGKISSATAPNGKVYTYGYTTSGFLASVTYPDALGTRTYHYEDSANPGGLTGVSIDGVRATRYAYRTDGRVAWSGMEGGIERSTFSYGTDYTDVTNALGQVTRHVIGEVNGLRQVVQVERPASPTCASGAVSTLYDANGNVDYELDAFGVKTDYTYDADGRRTRVVAGIGPNGETDQQRITDYGWDATKKTRLLWVKTYGTSTSAPQSIVSYAYFPDGDVRARLLMSVSIRNLTATGIANQTLTTNYSYTLHPNGMVATTTVDGPLSGTGDAIVRVYDTAGNLTATQNSLGHTTQFSNYNALGQPGRIVSANGATTDYTFDARGNRLTKTDWLGGAPYTTKYEHDGRGRLSKVTSPDGEWRAQVWDAADRLDKAYTSHAEEDGDPGTYDEATTDTVDYSYNANSDLISESVSHNYRAKEFDPDVGKVLHTNVTTTLFSATYDYDAGGFLSARRGNNGQNVRFSYNANGDLATVTDSLNGVTTYQYDRLRRIKSVTDARNARVQIGYDASDRVTRIIDPRNLQTTYVYDGLGQKWVQQSPDTGDTAYQHDAYGRLASMTREDGQVTTYVYDSLGRVASATSASKVQAFAYDTCANGKGRVCTITDPTGSTRFTFTPQGQVATQLSYMPSSGSGQVSYTYDGLGRVARISYPGNVAADYTYRRGELFEVKATVAGVQSTVASLEHQPFGPLTRLYYGNGLYSRFNYDNDRRVTGISTNDTGGPIQSLTYALNANDDITAITDGMTASMSQNFTYDQVSRLLSVTATNANQSWTYDASGNRSSHTWGGATDTYSTAITSNRLSAIGGSRPKTFGFTPNGNVASVGQNIYDYDEFNRLSSVSNAGGTTTYAVNAQGQRVYKQGPAGQYWFMYGLDGSLLAEFKAGQSWTAYIRAEGNVIGFVRGGQKYYVHSDHLGRPHLVSNGTKAVVWRANNQAFNRSVILDSIGGFNLGFPGQYYDAETGNWQNGFRDYDPSIGRYLQSDPIGLAGGVNTYAYVKNNPLRWVDPFGLQSRTDRWAQGVVNNGADEGSVGEATLYDTLDAWGQSIRTVFIDIPTCTLECGLDATIGITPSSFIQNRVEEGGAKLFEAGAKQGLKDFAEACMSDKVDDLAKKAASKVTPGVNAVMVAKDTYEFGVCTLKCGP